MCVHLNVIIEFKFHYFNAQTLLIWTIEWPIDYSTSATSFPTYNTSLKKQDIKLDQQIITRKFECQGCLGFFSITKQTQTKLLTNTQWFVAYVNPPLFFFNLSYARTQLALP